MNRLTHALVAAVLAVGLSAPASAGQVRLEIRDGLVTLEAKDASPREILAEWARVGKTRVVNAERVPGGPLTLSLSGVPEAKALDLILRSVGGYVAAPRPVVVAAASRYDRIMVMPVARPAGGVPAPPPPTPTTTTFGRPQRGNIRQPAVILDDQGDPVVQEEPEPEEQPMQPGSAAQPGMPTSQPAMPNTPSPTQGQAPGAGPATAPPSAPTPGMPTAAPGAAKPGMPTTPPKPPGGGPGGQ
jgi:hypothetical protein